jgi:formyl-CoA transferase
MIDGSRPSVASPPPALGQDTDAILSTLGYNAEQIAAFRAEGVV